MIVYSNQIEPEGYELGDDVYPVECPRCGSSKATERFWESCNSGSIENSRELTCGQCGYTEEDINDEMYDGNPFFDTDPLAGVPKDILDE